jgi:hypothetical protein
METRGAVMPVPAIACPGKLHSHLHVLLCRQAKAMCVQGGKQQVDKMPQKPSGKVRHDS